MLKKVIVILEKESSNKETDEFVKMLHREGIDCVRYIAERENGEKEIIDESDNRIEEILQELDEHVSGKNYETLFISSNPDICLLAIEGGCSCIAYIGCVEDRSFGGIRYAIESLENIDIDYLDKICRRYAGLPWKILETERCIVREMTVEDVDAFYEIYKEPSITAYMEGLYPEREQETDYIKSYIKNIYEFYEYGLWTVVEKQSSEIIGRAGISWREETETVELGYVIAKPFQRQGYAYEVCNAILKYAYEELEIEQVAAYIKEGNEASEALCRKLKFEQKENVIIKNASYEKWLTILAKNK